MTTIRISKKTFKITKEEPCIEPQDESEAIEKEKEGEDLVGWNDDDLNEHE
jgi:hypothetical protein